MLEEALKNYNFAHPETVFIRHNENMTYEISDRNRKYLLRIHKSVEKLDFSISYGDTPRQVFIESEIELLKKLHYIDSIKTQYPIRNLADEYVTRLESGDLVTVLSWLDGHNLVNTTITEGLIYQIGQMIGKLHNATAQMSSVKRCCYDAVYISRVSNEIRKAYEVKHIGERSYELIEKVLSHIKQILAEEKRNFILIHDDLSKSNIIYNKGNLSPIDFSLSGYGIPEMELGQIICSLHKDEYIPSLVAGYESIGNRKINNSYIKAFTALSIILYIVIHHNKVYKSEKFVEAMNRWCNTFFIPANIQLEG
ncbi:phosphotransferase [Clostridium ljungdahlii]|uniref:Homoserine kinase n=1 Tax=Clostridium ljungdahlii TaxID=1538 RepID=A0A166REL8_9CLOT|nr:phosphotransferase [Clostridium ljungdahlii]OAA90741.1 homoserine kinase [Clostridium ljungdahlii]